MIEENPDRGNGFTLVELLVSMAIVALLCVILVQITGATGTAWRYTANKAEQFEAARTGFESMTRKIRQSTLNTYWDYDNPNALTNSGDPPARYIRQSELRFICAPVTSGTDQLIPTPVRSWPTQGIFFHATLGFVDRTTSNYRGLESLLNTWGYFVEFGSDSDLRPAFLTQQIEPLRYRFRLMELMAPSEDLVTYSKTSGAGNLTYTGHDWFTTFVNVATGVPRPVRVLAENVVTLVILAKLSKQEAAQRAAAGLAPLSPDYIYDSTAKSSDPEVNPSNQLPPVVQVTMVAIDEVSASRLASGNGQQMPVLGAGLFVDSTMLFDDPSTPQPGDGDLSKLEAQLTGLKLNYRVFTADVAIRAAKWSRNQVQ